MTVFIIFGMPVIMVIAIALFKTIERHKRDELRADLYAKALEKGQSVPNDWFVDIPKPRESNSLKIGLIFIAVGLGIITSVTLLFGAFIMVGEFPLRDGLIPVSLFGGAGIIALFVGIAFMINHFIEKKNKAANHAE